MRLAFTLRFAALLSGCFISVTPAFSQSFTGQIGARVFGNSPQGTKVTNGTLSQMPANMVKCNPTGSAANAQDCAKPWVVVTAPNFGAKCDGVTDDTAAIQAGINFAAANDRVLSLPAGTCKFSSPLSYSNASNWGIAGLGKNVSILNYTGASTTTDLVAFGNPSGAASNYVTMTGFAVTSSTKMTAGSGLHLMNTGYTKVSDFRADGELGNGNLWLGIWFDHVTNGDAILSYDLRAQCDGLRVNYGADLIMDGGGRIRYSANASTACAGLHVGGGFGGLECHSGDIIQNARNILVDHAITATQNRELLIHSACVVDTASVDDGIQLNDSLQNAGTFEFAGYDSGNKQHGINVISWPHSNLSIRGRIWNNGVGGTGDNIHLADTTTAVSFDPASEIWGLAVGDTTGWGINCTGAMTLFGSVVVRLNGSQNINPNCTFQAFGGYAAGGILGFSNTNPQASFSGTNAGGTLGFTLSNSSTASGSVAQQLVATGTAFNFTSFGAQMGATPFSFVNAGSGSTGGLQLNAAAGPVALQTNGLNSFATRTQGHWEAAGGTPILSACGTSPAIVGTDQSGQVTMGTGNPTGCTITFATAYAAAPFCTVTWQGSPLASQSYSISTSAITLTQTATSSNNVNYQCTARAGG